MTRRTVNARPPSSSNAITPTPTNEKMAMASSAPIQPIVMNMVNGSHLRESESVSACLRNGES